MSEAPELSDDSDVEPGGPGTCVAVVCPDSAIDSSYFAAGLARRLAEKEAASEAGRTKDPIVLVDGLPGTGGLDVIADLDRAPGARWTALRGVEGALDVERLIRALPTRDGVCVLAHERACDLVDSEVRARTIRSLGDAASWVIATQPPDRLPDDAFGTVVLLLRGSVAGIVAAQRYVEQMTGELPVAVVAMEMSSSTRAVVADSLGHPLVAGAPTRWRLSHAAGHESAAGMWPGTRDRVLNKLLDEVVVYLRSQGRSIAWA